MTRLVYVPKKLYREWMRKGWIPVSTEVGTKEWAILMAPPGWKSPKDDEDAIEKGSVEEGD